MTTVFQKLGVVKQTLLRGSSFTMINIISPVRVQTTHDQDDPPVYFYKNGKLVYVSHINGHFVWDVNPSMRDSDYACADQWSDIDNDDFDRHRRNKKKRRKNHKKLLSLIKDLNSLMM
ncbi:hypothetical protein AHAS_Ahas11G0089200 [Arachis hypogaea]